MDSKERIKAEARKLFFSHGLKSTSMEDIAKQCSISKQTIYKHFQNKNAIVALVVKDMVTSHSKLFENARLTSNDAIGEVLKQDATISTVCTGLRPSFFYELETFFPTIWNRMQQYRSKIYDGIMNNLGRGKREGVYRRDTDDLAFAEMRLQQLVNAVKPDQLSELKITAEQLPVNFTILYLQALTTEKGKQLLHKYLPK